MSKQFDSQISIVTGAGSGIGLATAEGLAAGGATVFCVDWKGAEEAAASIRAKGGNATGVALDVRDSAGWRTLIEDVIERHGPIDILVNNAGIAVPGDTAADVSEEVWDRILDINAKGVWLGMRAVLPGMVARKHGNRCATLFGEFYQVIQIDAEFACGFDRTGIVHLALPQGS